MQGAVKDEIESMSNHNDFFNALNIFYIICPNKMALMLDEFDIEENRKEFYCKLLENTLPAEFIPIFKLDNSKNDSIVEKLIREFFKVYVDTPFQLRDMKIAKIYENNVSILFDFRHMYDVDSGIL